MRVSTQVKEKTRDKILDAAREAFIRDGFDRATTRDIAAKAGIAVGTLFNYFASKESLAVALVASALERSATGFQRTRRGAEALEELLFMFIVENLRCLEPYRESLSSILESSMSPFAVNGSTQAQQIRADHVELIAQLIREDQQSPEPTFVTMHLYWSLYLGVLAFWSQDDSPKQEQTLAVLDQTLRLFVSALKESSSRGV